MKISYYSILIAIGGILFCTNIVRAQSNVTADCGVVVSNIAPVFGLVNEELLPIQARDRATANLRAYCCEQNIIRNISGSSLICDSNKDIPANRYFPHSAYLFDHLVDVMLRRLDGEIALLYPDVPVHPVGLAWRNAINSYAHTPGGVIPLDLISTINRYRSDGNNTNTLIDLYSSVCDVAYAAYSSLDSSQSSPAAAQTKNHIQACKYMVEERIQQELQYTRTIINLMANRLLHQYMSSTIVDYYSNTKLMHLQSTIDEMVNAFVTVNRLVVEGTKRCSM